MNVLVIPPYEQPYTTEIDADAGEQLTQLQGLVGGYIEMVRLPQFGQMTVGIVNEEGKIMNLPSNSRATMIYGQNDVIAGTMVVASVTPGGDLADAPHAALVWLERMGAVVGQS